MQSIPTVLFSQLGNMSSDRFIIALGENIFDIDKPNILFGENSPPHLIVFIKQGSDKAMVCERTLGNPKSYMK